MKINIQNTIFSVSKSRNCFSTTEVCAVIENSFEYFESCQRLSFGKDKSIQISTFVRNNMGRILNKAPRIAPTSAWSRYPATRKIWSIVLTFVLQIKIKIFLQQAQYCACDYPPGWSNLRLSYAEYCSS